MHRYSCPRPVSQSCRPTPFSRSRCSVWSAALALRDSGRLRLTLQQMIDRFALIFTSQLKDNNGHFQVATTVLLCSFRLLATSSAAFRFPAYTSRPFLANPFCKLPH
uniref:(northern house mosquito) hypothetical protein n=1 Tax=Culex pipiens TaxID=7175 RepID=A0A8D8G6U4_CULPI